MPCWWTRSKAPTRARRSTERRSVVEVHSPSWDWGSSHRPQALQKDIVFSGQRGQTVRLKCTHRRPILQIQDVCRAMFSSLVSMRIDIRWPERSEPRVLPMQTTAQPAHPTARGYRHLYKSEWLPTRAKAYCVSSRHNLQSPNGACRRGFWQRETNACARVPECEASYVEHRKKGHCTLKQGVTTLRLPITHIHLASWD